MESLEKTVRLFFPPFPQNLEIDVADFHITTATTTTRGEERATFSQLSGIMVVADRKD
jgi:hypothetical protein